MRNFLYALLIIAIVITALVIVMNWNSIMAWWNKPQTINNEPQLPTCQQQYDAARAELAKSGKSCVQTVADVVCPSDSTFVVSVNPCLEQILKDKGWQSADQNGSNNSNGNNSSSVQYDLEVSNPNGAFMYYQQDLASGGKIYSASNLLIPFGTKLKLIKIWQTNLSTQPFSGFYETEYKDYGSNSGFFSTQDVKQI